MPVFFAETPPPFVVSALFRVGRADELATTSGMTHLVEHLALPAQSRRRIDFNGTVDNIITTFWASGAEDEAERSSRRPHAASPRSRSTGSRRNGRSSWPRRRPRART